MPPAKANTVGRESGENFMPMECAFGKSGFYWDENEREYRRQEKE
jgi:hypothetical protein